MAILSLMTHIPTQFTHTTDPNQLKRRLMPFKTSLHDKQLIPNLDVFRKAVEEEYMVATEQELNSCAAWRAVSGLLLPSEYRSLTDAWGELVRAPSILASANFTEVCESIKKRARTGNIN